MAGRGDNNMRKYVKKQPKKAKSVTVNSGLKPGMSRYCDEYKTVPYGERVRLENSLTNIEVKLLDFIAENGECNDAMLERKFREKKPSVLSLVDRGILTKEKGRINLSKKGYEIWEAIIKYGNLR